MWQYHDHTIMTDKGTTFANFRKLFQICKELVRKLSQEVTLFLSQLRGSYELFMWWSKPTPSPPPPGINLIASHTLSLLMPALVMSWQSYSSIRCNPWQPIKCSSEESVMRGQLSSSMTWRCSVEQPLVPMWRMPSSVISSQWDNVWKREDKQHISLIMCYKCKCLKMHQ